MIAREKLNLVMFCVMALIFVGCGAVHAGILGFVASTALVSMISISIDQVCLKGRAG